MGNIISINGQRGPLIAIGGGTACGKSKAREYACTMHKAYGARFSDHLRSVARKQGRPTDKKTLQAIWLEEREKYGFDHFLPAFMCERLKQYLGMPMIVEGLRMPHDVQMLRSFAKRNGAAFGFIYIDASKEDRFNWNNKRRHERQKLPWTIDKFEESEGHDCESRLAEICKLADVCIQNEPSVPLRVFVEKVSSEMKRYM